MMVERESLNRLFTGVAEQEDGCLQHWCSLVQVVASRLSPTTAFSMLVDDDYPLLRKAVSYTQHKKEMIRCSARKTYITLLRIPNFEVQEVALRIIKTELLGSLRSLLKRTRQHVVPCEMLDEPLAKACALCVQAAGGGPQEAVKPPMVVCPAFCHPVAAGRWMPLLLASRRNATWRASTLGWVGASGGNSDALEAGRNRAAQAKSPDELRQEPTTMSGA